MGGTIVGGPCASPYGWCVAPTPADIVVGGRTNGCLSALPSGPEDAPMKRRILAAMLWFYVGWYATSWIIQAASLPEPLGPIVGLTLAVAIAGDPRRRIWRSAAGARTRPELGSTVPLSSGSQGM